MPPIQYQKKKHPDKPITGSLGKNVSTNSGLLKMHFRFSLENGKG